MFIVRWLVQRGIVAIPKSVRKERTAESFAVLDFALSDEEMQAIVARDRETSSFFDHPLLADPLPHLRIAGGIP